MFGGSGAGGFFGGMSAGGGNGGQGGGPGGGGDALDDRLVELLYRDITPEDYDFLLKLDESN